MPQEPDELRVLSRSKQSLEEFTADINQALQRNLLGFSETVEFSTALGAIKARLDSHRNSLVPINKLPVETLARIFEFVVASDLFRSPIICPASVPPPEATWNKRLVFVCTRWCKIVTKWTRMWYFIVDDDIEPGWKTYHPSAVLRQSGSTVPLHLYMTSASQPTTTSISRWIIKNQPFCVEALYLKLIRDTPVQTILESLATSLPSLRLLSVDGNVVCPETHGTKMLFILGGGALNLRALMWTLHIPFLPENSFPNLADLIITQSDGRVLNLDRLLRLLSNCPRLETLNIRQSTFDATTGIAPERRPVALGRLRALWIHAMPVNAGLTTLAYLQLPHGATVRVSDLIKLPPEPLPPTIPIPFLQKMDDFVRLDVVASAGRDHPSMHIIAVGTHSRFWIHFRIGPVADARPYVRHLCGMLLKKHLRTVRCSVEDVADLAIVCDVLRDPFPSLDTLLVRHSRPAAPADASSSIDAMAKTRCPGGAPGDGVPHTTKESDRDSGEYVPDGASNTGSDSSSGTGPDGGSDDGDAAAAAAQHSPSLDEDISNNDHDHDNKLPSGTGISGDVPAPHLKVLGLQIKCGAEAASLASVVRMLDARKQAGHPLHTVLCSLVSTDAKDVEAMKEHAVYGVRYILGALWVPTIDEGWRVRNDYVPFPSIRQWV